MTGEPGYTFRGQEENPTCPQCSDAMRKEETVQQAGEEVDVYVCLDCATEYLDKWSY